ncbi:MAG: MBL fold metallo-hydrolase [Bacteroidales bacterium]|jgi:glyoxylase-like metal-dependent hydrolase (beta-lactamase superfamily II)|nr:MBL fold metallo-hydrolase [Bacteroidales bacterium]
MKSWTTSDGNKIIQVLSGRSNVILLTNGRSHILIDTSPGYIWNTLQKRLKKLRVEEIKLLILTHSHFDHAANARKIKERYNARVVIHRSEAKYLTTGDNILPTGTNPLSRFLVRVFAKQFDSYARYEPCTFDYIIDDTFNLTGFGFNAYLMHTPGHTAGSVSLIIDNEAAIVGDTMVGIFPWTILPPFASDTAQLINSWEKLLKTGCQIFIPSHGLAIKRARVKKHSTRF